MADRNNFVVILVTAPDQGVAEGLARELLEARLVACVNIIPGLRSLYWWESRIETAGEVLMLLKARRADVDGIVKRVRGRHPYSVPEIIAVDITSGLPAYLDWISAETERRDG